MAPTRLTEALLPLSQRQQLLEVARGAICAGLARKDFLIRGHDYPEVLRLVRANFVTLYVDVELRGCIGNLESRRPLVEDVAHNAYAAAFDDPRFAALTLAEFGRLDIHLSILNSPEALTFASELDLLQQLRPRIDGLVIQDGRHRGTFLPSVWEQLPQPALFLRELKHKAGLPADYWSPTLVVQRYTVETVR